MLLARSAHISAKVTCYSDSTFQRKLMWFPSMIHALLMSLYHFCYTKPMPPKSSWRAHCFVLYFVETDSLGFKMKAYDAT